MANKQSKRLAKTTKQSTFDYSAIPSSIKLMEVVNRMPQLPQSWREIPTFEGSLAEWHEELQQAAHNVCVAANDATGLMAEIIDGKRKIDDEATRMIAMITAVRA